jgi:hypothetical protein
MRFNMKIAQEKAGKEIEREVKKYTPPTKHVSPNPA